MKKMEIGPGTRKACIFLVFYVRIAPRGNVPLFNSWGYSFQLELVFISWELRICLRKWFKIFPLLLLQPDSFKYQLPFCIFILCNCVKGTENLLPVFLKCKVSARSPALKTVQSDPVPVKTKAKKSYRGK